MTPLDITPDELMDYQDDNQSTAVTDDATGDGTSSSYQFNGVPFYKSDEDKQKYNITPYEEYLKQVQEANPMPKAPEMRPAEPDSPAYQRIMSELANYDMSTEDPDRDKRNLRIAAIGDGLSALANLVGAANGAENAFDAKTDMSAQMRERYDKLDAQLKSAKDKYYDLAIRRANVLQRDQKQRNAAILAGNTAAQKAYNNDLKARDAGIKSAMSAYGKEQTYANGMRKQKDSQQFRVMQDQTPVTTTTTSSRSGSNSSSTYDELTESNKTTTGKTSSTTTNTSSRSKKYTPAQLRALGLQ